MPVFSCPSTEKGKAGYNLHSSLLNSLKENPKLHALDSMRFLNRPQPVHRLDKATGGLLLVAKTYPGMLILTRNCHNLTRILTPGKFLLIFICNFHALSHLLMIYMCKLHWSLKRKYISFSTILCDLHIACNNQTKQLNTIKLSICKQSAFYPLTALIALSESFKQKEVEKIYLAMVVGSLSGNGTMSSPLGGKAAVTHYESLAISPSVQYGSVSTIKVDPLARDSSPQDP